MKRLQGLLSRFGNLSQDVALLFIRLVLAYGFYETAKMKWSDIQSVAQWFESMNYPLPELNAYLAATTEALGVILLALGLMTRFISLPLMFVMLVAIFTVHLENGFSVDNNGFELPLYYLLMLFTLWAYGPGRWSLDRFLWKEKA